MEGKMDASTHSSEKLRQAVDGYWETFPPLWRSIQAHIRQVATEQFDITVEQFHILRHIRRGLDSVSALAETRGISRPAVSQSVDLLVTRGLILRTTDPQDRRHIKLDLTSEGNALMDAVFGDTRQWMMKKFAPLSADEIQALTYSMESLKKIL
jgi:DNA-binding MarR family transcriptional regulator